MKILHKFWFWWYNRKGCSLAETLIDIEFNKLCPVSVAHQLCENHINELKELFKNCDVPMPKQSIDELIDIGILPSNARIKMEG